MENTTDLIEKAREFAAKTHERQMYGDKPYMYHLDDCFILFTDIVSEHESLYMRKIKEKIGAAIYLHDTMEDEGVHFAILEDRFGKDVAEAVWCVTKEKPYNPDEYFKKISQNPIAAIVKLCDRVCNVNNCFDKEGYVLPEHISKMEKYIQEDKYILNILDYDSLTELSENDKNYVKFIIGELHPAFHKSYLQRIFQQKPHYSKQTNQSHENVKPSKADEDQPANDEFSMRIVINSEGTTISLSADFSKLKYPQSFIGALEQIKYKIIQQHGFIK